MKNVGRMSFEQIKTEVIGKIEKDICKYEKYSSSSFSTAGINTKKQMLNNIDETVCLYIASMVNNCINNANEPFFTDSKSYKFFKKLGIEIPKDRTDIYKVFEFFNCPFELPVVDKLLEPFIHVGPNLDEIYFAIIEINGWEDFFEFLSKNNCFPSFGGYRRRVDKIKSMLSEGYSIDQIMEMVTNAALTLRYFKSMTIGIFNVDGVVLPYLSEYYYERLEKWKNGMEKWKDYFSQPKNIQITATIEGDRPHESSASDNVLKKKMDN